MTANEQKPQTGPDNGMNLARRYGETLHCLKLGINRVLAFFVALILGFDPSAKFQDSVNGSFSGVNDPTRIRTGMNSAALGPAEPCGSPGPIHAQRQTQCPS